LNTIGKCPNRSVSYYLQFQLANVWYLATIYSFCACTQLLFLYQVQSGWYKQPAISKHATREWTRPVQSIHGANSAPWIPSTHRIWWTSWTTFRATQPATIRTPNRIPWSTRILPARSGMHMLVVWLKHFLQGVQASHMATVFPLNFTVM
jgi:hypothetical protein